jgi:hypothetical protein
MTIPINMTLYRLLVKHGATEAEAEQAASVDASMLATKADIAELKAAIADTKAGILMWMITAMLAQTALIFTVLRFGR